MDEHRIWLFLCEFSRLEQTGRNSFRYPEHRARPSEVSDKCRVHAAAEVLFQSQNSHPAVNALIDQTMKRPLTPFPRVSTRPYLQPPGRGSFGSKT